MATDEYKNQEPLFTPFFCPPEKFEAVKADMAKVITAAQEAVAEVVERHGLKSGARYSLQFSDIHSDGSRRAVMQLFFRIESAPGSAGSL